MHVRQSQPESGSGRRSEMVCGGGSLIRKFFIVSCGISSSHGQEMPLHGEKVFRGGPVVVKDGKV